MDPPCLRATDDLFLSACFNEAPLRYSLSVVDPAHYWKDAFCNSMIAALSVYSESLFSEQVF